MLLSKHQPELLKEYLSIYPTIEYVKGIPTNVNIIFDRNQPNLLILDHKMDDGNGDKYKSQLFIRGQHENICDLSCTLPTKVKEKLV